METLTLWYKRYVILISLPLSDAITTAKSRVSQYLYPIPEIDTLLCKRRKVVRDMLGVSLPMKTLH